MLKLLVGLDLGFQGDIEIEGIPVTKENLSWNKSEDWICVSGFGKPAFRSNVYDEIAFAPRNYGLSGG